MKRVIVIILACCGCATPKTIRVEPKITLEVTAGQWTSCARICGGASELLAITEKQCICKNGIRFPHGSDLYKIETPADLPQDSGKSQSIFEMMGASP